MSYTPLDAVWDYTNGIMGRVTAAESDCAAINGNISSLLSRMTTAETNVSNEVSARTTLASRVTVNESDITALKAWRAAKATAITPAALTATSTALTVLGLSVLSAASGDTLAACCAELKTKVNGILAMLSAREIMA